MEVDGDNGEIKQNSEILSNILIEEPLLGSVTTFNSIEGGETKSQQIRTSARVSKKMKLDLTPSVPVIMEKKEKKEEVKVQDHHKRVYRPLWTSDDKTIFFEALNEYGKDFESIQIYISNKLKKRGIPENLIKTKDQVRHLYYRTWNKITKYAKFCEDVKKVVQELYGLINYGELRKKLGSVNEKSFLKLNELIYKGSTVIRVKGKNIRIKTPMCRALRKLNQLDEKYDEIKLPTRVAVELRPKDMTSFLKVQSMAQNPRLRAVLPLQKRLSSLICCLSRRLKSVDAVNYDKAITSTNPITNDCIPPTEESLKKKELFVAPLRLSPLLNCKIELSSINLSEYFTRQSICLTAYEERAGIKADHSFLNKTYPKKNFRHRTDSVSKSPSKISTIVEETNSCLMENESSSLVDKVVDEAVNTILSLQPSLHQIENEENERAKLEAIKVKQEKEELENELINEERRARMESIRKGWTEKDCESLTVGEIYLMLGSDSKVILEYSWDKQLFTDNTSNGDIGNHLPDWCEQSNEDKPLEDYKNSGLSHSLTKLLSLAKLHYRKNIIKCPCGHVCGTKSNANLKQDMETKIRKILTDIDKCTDETEVKIKTEETFLKNGTRTNFASPVYMQQNYSPATYFHPPTTPVVHLMAQDLNAIRRLKPRYCNRRGRTPRSKQVVVERKLPLLPNRVDVGHHIVRMNIISREESDSSTSSEENTLVPTADQAEGSSADIKFAQCSHNMEVTDAVQASSLMTDLNNDDGISTVPPSPLRILKEGEDQWINSEVADYSLSSLLGRLESPIKSGSSTITNEDSRLSQDVDAQLQSLLSESSLDFSANFADLAAQVANEIKK